jgi:hypothetical protein
MGSFGVELMEAKAWGKSEAGDGPGAPPVPDIAIAVEDGQILGDGCLMNLAHRLSVVVARREVKVGSTDTIAMSTQ